jgi:hypothetical protein
LLLSARQQQQASMKVLFAERAASMTGNEAWLHSATLLLFGNQAGVEIAMPPGCTINAALADDRKVAPRTTASGGVWIPFAHTASAHRVQVWWRCQDESLSRPDLSAPSLKGLDQVAWISNVLVPNGYQLAAESQNVTKLGTVEQALLREVESYLELTRLLGREATEVLAAQVALHRLCDRILERLALDSSPRGKRTLAALQQLQKQNEQLLDDRELDHVRRAARARAAETPAEAPPLDQGVPICVLDSAEPLRLQLFADSDVFQAERVFASQMVVILFIGLWLLSYASANVARVLRSCWPEQLAVLAGLGWLILGPSVAGAALFALAVLGRTLLLFIWFNRAKPRLASSSSSFRS